MALLIVSTVSTAQLVGGGGEDDPPSIAYEVNVASGAAGRAGEYPLNYGVEYDNGDIEDVSITEAGLFERQAPPGAVNVVAIWWFGIRIPVGADIVCTQPDSQGGCWCLCLKWIDVTWPPWKVTPIFIWYYDPCCH
jgi:hypothetical protein